MRLTGIVTGPMSRASGETSWEGIALLRFFLAWVVFAGHLNLFTPEPSWLGAFDQFGGKAAVIGFLLVSGFSIASSIERQGEGFFRRRFLRIYPLYFTAIVFGFALEIWTGGQVTAPGRTFEALGWPTALGNLIFAQTFAVKPLGFDGPVWSLAIEVFYYALAPVFLLLERKWLLGIAVVSMVCYGLPRHTDWGFAY